MGAWRDRDTITKGPFTVLSIWYILHLHSTTKCPIQRGLACPTVNWSHHNKSRRRVRHFCHVSKCVPKWLMSSTSTSGVFFNFGRFYGRLKHDFFTMVSDIKKSGYRNRNKHFISSRGIKKMKSRYVVSLMGTYCLICSYLIAMTINIAIVSMPSSTIQPF